jgi:hypothetical protein
MLHIRTACVALLSILLVAASLGEEEVNREDQFRGGGAGENFGMYTISRNSGQRRATDNSSQCTEECTNCSDRVDPFLAADPNCTMCSRIEPEDGQERGACVLLGALATTPPNGPTTGGYIVTITGEYFGSSADTPAPGVVVKIGSSSCAALEWISRTSVACKVPPGVGAPAVFVAVGSPASRCPNCGVLLSTEGLFRYDRPSIYRTAMAGRGARLPAGGFPVALVGSGFGTFDSKPTAFVESFYGGNVAANLTLWTSGAVRYAN